MTSAPLIKTTTESETALGGGAFLREEKGELFIAAVSSLTGAKAHETGGSRSERVIELTRQVALEDPAWVMRFDRWLRDEANIRTLTIEVACAFVKARLDEGVPDEAHPGTPGMNRTVINVACGRADEPSRLLEYWVAKYGRNIPKPVKRGVSDAVQRLWNEFSVLKYDTSTLKWRFADVLELCHAKPDPTNPTQGALFEWILNRRHELKDSTTVLKDLPMATARTHVQSLMDSEESKRILRENLIAEPETLKDAGMTWENLSALGPMDREAWEAVIPTMGYMALLRNLRNFDDAKISARSVKYIQGRLSDEAAVRKSRVFPFRFYSAAKVADPRWVVPLEQAVRYSVSSIPELGGSSLILVDCSGSMFDYVSDRSKLTRMEQAALFGSAVALKCETPTLAQYGTKSELVVPDKDGVLATMKKFKGMGGTNTAVVLKDLWNKGGPYDRVIIVTDEQHSGWGVDPGTVIPADAMLYTWNIGGYSAAHAEATPYRHTFAGLTDQSFKMIPLIESGLRYDWPF
jgi:hypothetical protein